MSRRALVLGGSIAGLLTARALADHFDEVVIVERDDVVGVRGVRRGVPQGAHVHGLLARGQQALEEYFPGFTREARRAGVPTADLGELRWFFNGKRLAPAETGLTCVSADRPVLEHLVRERVRALPGVILREGQEVSSLVFDDTRRTVLGAMVAPRGTDRREMVQADVVVDALGRGSPVARWVHDAGYGRPEEETVKIDLSYTSRHYEFDDESVLRGDLSINPVSCPQFPRGAFFSRVQDGGSLVSLTGVMGDHPATDEEGFLAWARSMEVPDVYEVMEAGRPVDDPVQFRFPKSVRRRFDRMSDFPAHLLIVGDAMCSFNPVYGQGMTVAALESELIGELAGKGEIESGEYFARAAQLLDGPWAASTGGDHAFLGTELPEEVRQANAFIAQVHEAATHDPVVTRAFMRVAGLVDPPEALMSAEISERVLAPNPIGLP
ncbi:FAD-dependent oxidoreductase [Myceligenerans xiligouense]|uniref:Flavin-dependent dehydrogenase n=1 Tax=Myceligenerans xiligouense TaxID=253184 RepID=A0A3N4YNH6_9MICO|nr:FAD-binding monooxygenase [Myceligenerans xiligouense]RPF20020.1 flavin-dependent dehydrogenase [Myceligenerans xiligouense]